MWMQNFTTNEPDDSMIECAIRSLELVLARGEGKGRMVEAFGEADLHAQRPSFIRIRIPI